MGNNTPVKITQFINVLSAVLASSG